VALFIFVEKFIKTDFLSDADIISMFGNLLDNALEASLKCDTGNKKVNVKLFMGNNFFLIFHIENTFSVSAKRDGTRLISTKDDEKTHGLGIGIVSNLAEKYGGSLTLEEKGDIFITTLAISTFTDKSDANFGTQSV
jgi:two-component system sensor histidine kinase AgrC